MLQASDQKIHSSIILNRENMTEATWYRIKKVMHLTARSLHLVPSFQVRGKSIEFFFLDPINKERSRCSTRVNIALEMVKLYLEGN